MIALAHLLTNIILCCIVSFTLCAVLGYRDCMRELRVGIITISFVIICASCCLLCVLLTVIGAITVWG